MNTGSNPAMSRDKERPNKKLTDKDPQKFKSIQESLPMPAEQEQTLAIQEAIDLAVQHHAAGDLPKAEGIYQQILQADPNQPIALHYLGMIAHQVGKNDIAIDLISKAIAITPDYVEAHINHGIVLKALGKLDEAISSYQNALAINPDLAEVHYNLGNTLQGLGMFDEVVVSYKKAIAIMPDFAAINVNFWITPKAANSNTTSGGLVVYSTEAPLSWDFETYNNNKEKILNHIENNDNGKTVVPYNENRIVTFNSNLIHETDKFEFKEGYENRRINVTMLFGKRGA